MLVAIGEGRGSGESVFVVVEGLVEGMVEKEERKCWRGRVGVMDGKGGYKQAGEGRRRRAGMVGISSLPSDYHFPEIEVKPALP